VVGQLIPRNKVETKLVVHRQVAWWIAAAICGDLICRDHGARDFVRSLNNGLLNNLKGGVARKRLGLQ